MATDEEDLALNTLHRFRKRSPRLTLQVHSHCEVPAGCGGVVLRWVDPSAGFGAVVHAVPADGLAAWLDGALIETSHVRLGFGDHVLALRVTPLLVRSSARRVRLFGRGEASVRPFACAVASDAPLSSRVAPATASSRPGWRFVALAEPPAGWEQPGFEDREWTPLQPCSVEPAALDSEHRWRFEYMARDFGARLLELPDAPLVFIRHAFRVEPR